MFGIRAGLDIRPSALQSLYSYLAAPANWSTLGWGWIEVNFRNQIPYDLHFRKILGTCQDFRTAAGEIGLELVDIATLVLGLVFLQIGQRRVIKFLRAARVAVAEMVQANRHLNQALVELARRPRILGPKLLPDFVRFVKIARIEVRYSFEIQRVILVGHEEKRFPAALNDELVALQLHASCHVLPGDGRGLGHRDGDTATNLRRERMVTNPADRPDS
jgi:hypothetical protein